MLCNDKIKKKRKTNENVTLPSEEGYQITKETISSCIFRLFYFFHIEYRLKPKGLTNLIKLFLSIPPFPKLKRINECTLKMMISEKLMTSSSFFEHDLQVS